MSSIVSQVITPGFRFVVTAAAAALTPSHHTDIERPRVFVAEYARPPECPAGALHTHRPSAKLAPCHRLLIATNNPGKVAELRILLEAAAGTVTPGEVGLALHVEETGETYHDNARLKALAGMKASGLVTLADDSGLEVQALGGEPGVHSARFLGDDVPFEERFC